MPKKKPIWIKNVKPYMNHNESIVNTATLYVATTNSGKRFIVENENGKPTKAAAAAEIQAGRANPIPRQEKPWWVLKF